MLVLVLMLVAVVLLLILVLRRSRTARRFCVGRDVEQRCIIVFWRIGLPEGTMIRPVRHNAPLDETALRGMFVPLFFCPSRWDLASSPGRRCFW